MGGGAGSGGSAGQGAQGGSAQGGSSTAGQGGSAHAGDSGGGSPPVGGSGGTGGSGTGGSSAGSGGSMTITGGTGGSGGSGGASTIITSCPTDPPAAMAACADGIVCTYGDDVRLSCRTRYVCTNGVFSVATSACKALASCSDRAGGVPIMGSACTTAGEECLLTDPPNYIYCRCDASWLCSATPAQTMMSCPDVAPNVGQPCDSGGLACQYGSCSYPAAYDPTLQCKGKAWQQAVSQCATPGGG